MHHKLLLLVCLLPTLASAQTLVGTAPETAAALLEEFTAMNCGNCPAAHAVAEDLAQTHGEELTIIGVHGGGLAIPGTGQPDLRSADGTALWSLFGVSFQPQGMVSRQGLLAHAQWPAAVADAIAATAPVNIGIASSITAGGELLTVNVELYYTNATAGDDRIHVAVTEDHITAWQTDYVNGNHPAYDHRHVLRDLVTPLVGDPVTSTEAGTFVERSFTLMLPAEWNPDELDVVVFVTDGDGPVHQVRSVRADGGSTVGLPEHANDASLLGPGSPMPASDLVHFALRPMVQPRTFRLLDPTGAVLRTMRVAPGERTLTLRVSDLPSGAYFFGPEGGVPRKVIVQH